MTPDIAGYDVIEVSTSGGKDSLTMLAKVARLAREAGVLDRVVAIHADLGRFEWPGTREIAEAQAMHLGTRFVAVKRPQGDFLDLVRHYRHWPKPDSRFCTAMLKRGQILRAMTNLAREVRASWPRGTKRPVRILNCIGLRAEESPGRAKHSAFKERGRGTSRRQTIDVWLPIHDMGEADVFAACRASGAPMHPAYAAGLPRASCVFCIYAPRDALIVSGRANSTNSTLLSEMAAVEREIGHDFKHHLPLAEVARDIAAGTLPNGPIRSWRM